MLNKKFHRWPLFRLLALERYFDVPKLLEAMNGRDVPKKLGFWALPENLREMTLGQRIQLIKQYEQGDLFYSTFSILTKIPKWVVMIAPIGKTYPFVHKVLEDLKYRARRDEALNLPLTPEQEAAGVGSMNHGWFGLIDVIVQRSGGRYDHDEASKLPDIRVFEMLRIDTDRAKVQRRMTEIMTKKQSK